MLPTATVEVADVGTQKKTLHLIDLLDDLDDVQDVQDNLARSLDEVE